MDDSMKQFIAEVDRSDMPPEKKRAAKEIVQRLKAGERIASVLKDLAEPLGVTPAMVMRHLVIDAKRPVQANVVAFRGNADPLH